MRARSGSGIGSPVLEKIALITPGKALDGNIDSPALKRVLPRVMQDVLHDLRELLGIGDDFELARGESRFDGYRLVSELGFEQVEGYCQLGDEGVRITS